MPKTTEHIVQDNFVSMKKIADNDFEWVIRNPFVKWYSEQEFQAEIDKRDMWRKRFAEEVKENSHLRQTFLQSQSCEGCIHLNTNNGCKCEEIHYRICKRRHDDYFESKSEVSK